MSAMPMIERQPLSNDEAVQCGFLQVGPVILFCN
jgi:hypothetical protein